MFLTKAMIHLALTVYSASCQAKCVYDDAHLAHYISGPLSLMTILSYLNEVFLSPIFLKEIPRQSLKAIKCITILFMFCKSNKRKWQSI